MTLGLVLTALASAAGAAFGGPSDPRPDFGANGVVLQPLGRFDASAGDVVRDPDGKLVVAGWSEGIDFTDGNIDRFALARFEADGRLDRTFSDTGESATRFGSQRVNHAEAIAPDGAGGYVASGFAGNPGNDADLILARFTSQGALDGHERLDLEARFLGAPGLARSPSGRFLVGGFTISAEGVERALVARFTPGGALDTTYSPDAPAGVTYLGDARGAGVAADARGRAVLVGTIRQSGEERAFVARFNNAGNPDSSFNGAAGSVGVRVLDLGTATGASAVKLQGQRILVAGSRELSGQRDGWVARFDEDGTRDLQFAPPADTTGGIARVAVPAGDEEVLGIAAGGTDAITVVGSTDDDAPGMQKRGLVARLTSSGAPDTTFNAGSADPSLRVYPLGDASDAQLAAAVVDGDRTWAAGDAVDERRRKVALLGLGTEAEAVNASPTAAFTWGQFFGSTPRLSLARPGRSTFFTASGIDSDGFVTRYRWDFDGDGTFEVDTGSASTASHTFPAPGAYTVGLEVTDDRGAIGRARQQVIVKINFPPIAQILPGELSSGGAPTAYVGESRTIDARTLDLDGEVVEHRWDLDGDGTFERGTGRRAAVDHVFKAAKPVRIRLRAEDNEGAETEAVLNVQVFGEYDLRVIGIEVTQGTQYEHEPCDAVDECTRLKSLQPQDLADPGPVRYRGVDLAKGGRTIVRVFANLGAPGKPSALMEDRAVTTKDAALFGYDEKGDQLPGSPISPESHAGELRGGRPWVTLAERARPRGAFNYVLPPEWTEHGRIRLRAVVGTYGEKRGECTTYLCSLTSEFTLTDIPFHDVGHVVVTPLDLRFSGQKSRPPAVEALAEARNLAPVRDGQIFVKPSQGYAGKVWVNGALAYDLGARGSYALDRIEDWTDEGSYGDVPFGIALGLANGTARGNFLGCAEDIELGLPPATAGALLHPCGSGLFTPVAYGEADRPLTSIGHELNHTFGRKHASGSCGGDGTEDKPQTYTSWPPDGRGLLQGVGLDRRPASGGTTGVYGLKVPARYLPEGHPGGKGQPDHWFDFMSYCTGADEQAAWISPRNWNRTLHQLRWFNVLKERVKGAAAARAAAARARRSGTARAAQGSRGHLLVRATADGPDVRIAAVKPGPGSVGAAPALTGYTLVAMDAGGRPVATANMFRIGDHGPRSLRAEVPAANVSSVAVVTAAGVAATRSRSASPPVLELLPTASRVPGGDDLTIRWRGRDADGDRLQASVGYSRDDGRSWQPLYVGESIGRLTVDGRVLAGSDRARVRVRLGDGFNQVEETSRRFRVEGSPPEVEIVSPGRRERYAAGVAIPLSGTAIDDRARPVPESRLRWFDGRRPLGRTGRRSVAKLAPGRHRLRLVARDRRGREGSASVVVRVTRTAPRFLTLRGPRKLSRRARRVVIRVASTLPARLVSGDRRFRVGRVIRRIRLRVEPGRRDLRLRLRLAGGGRQSVGYLRVDR